MSVIIAIMGLLSLAGAKAVDDGEQIEDAVAVFAGFGIGTLVLGIGVIVLTIIGYVLLIKGTNLASRDEPTYFRGAFGLAIMILVASVLYNIVQSVPNIAWLSRYFNGIVNVGMIFLTINIVLGIRTIAEQIGRNDISSMSMPIIVIEIIVYVFAALAPFINRALTVVSAVAALVGYIIYLIYLVKAKNMFNN